jgi:hypothetical protein
MRASITHSRAGQIRAIEIAFVRIDLPETRAFQIL